MQTWATGPNVAVSQILRVGTRCKISPIRSRRFFHGARISPSASFAKPSVTRTSSITSVITALKYRFNPSPKQQARLFSYSSVMTQRAYIALGSNLGDRVAAIEEACRQMESGGRIKILRTSSLWETRAMYVLDQNKFVNGVCEVGLPGDSYSLTYHVLTHMHRLTHHSPQSSFWMNFNRWKIRWVGSRLSTKAPGISTSTYYSTGMRCFRTTGFRSLTS
jgi:hypothetical protein